MHSAIKTAPDEQTTLAYIALANTKAPACRAAEIMQRGPIEILDRLPADIARHQRDNAARQLDRAHAGGIRAIVPGHPEWPHQIDDLNEGNAALEAPLCLWARGPLFLPAALERSLMVTGARAATSHGVRIATDICYHLADGTNQWTIANQGAYGVDTAALTAAAIAPERVPPVVMLPVGLDRYHRAAHANMFDSIALTGLLISAYAPGVRYTRASVARSQLYLAALTSALVITEAIPYSSAGFIPAAHRAAGLGRPVMAAPGPANSPQSTVCNELLRTGIAHRITNARDVTDRLTPRVG